MRFELLDLGAGVVERPGRERALVDGEAFDRGFFERLAEASDGVAVVEVVEVALAFARGRGDVEAGLLAGAGEGDVAPFLEAVAAGAEDESALDGDALAGVAGERVGVADVAGCEVVAASSSTRSPRSVTTLSVRCSRSTVSTVARVPFLTARASELRRQTMRSPGRTRCRRW